jgi:GNAT superfamily N-acetyltransferase
MKEDTVRYKFADTDNIEEAQDIRLEMLRTVNGLPADYEYDKSFISATRDYFINGDQITVLAADDDNEVIGCATMSYIAVMPTFSHPTGKRAHLMNVYVREKYRRKGIAAEMVELLIEDAGRRGATEVSLDATPMGRPLYEKLGFKASEECMTLKTD